jgi:hypothetical protein
MGSKPCFLSRQCFASRWRRSRGGSAASSMTSVDRGESAVDEDAFVEAELATGALKPVPLREQLLLRPRIAVRRLIEATYPLLHLPQLRNLLQFLALVLSKRE